MVDLSLRFHFSSSIYFTSASRCFLLGIHLIGECVHDVLVLIVLLIYWSIIVLTTKEEIITINGIIKKTMFIKELIKGEIPVITIILIAAKELIRMAEITSVA